MTGPDADYLQYLAMRDQASEDWRRLAQLTDLVATQFTTDMPHGGDLEALRRTFASATRKTRKAVAHYRAWLSKQSTTGQRRALVLPRDELGPQ